MNDSRYGIRIFDWPTRFFVWDEKYQEEYLVDLTDEDTFYMAKCDCDDFKWHVEKPIEQLAFMEFKQWRKTNRTMCHHILFVKDYLKNLTYKPKTLKQPTFEI